jgi:cell division septation protein DedD
VSGYLPVVRGDAGGRYHVQVGALTDQAAAEALVRRLRALGYAVRIVGAQPYLVWVGGYLDAPTAARLISRLRGQGFNAVLINQR